ncbi:hypothetical protein GGD57_002802 [Rhizobium esperanzae]|uniref:Uncharacterized protein n=1 Tax=Rhizobium esperanzae TaxID=1967781 RepID=A0A7W6R3M9_9HYPH|nr:hypothetical protein [Rhizobium esperanzae]
MARRRSQLPVGIARDLDVSKNAVAYIARACVRDGGRRCANGGPDILQIVPINLICNVATEVSKNYVGSVNPTLLARQ